jgi:hypothetical protein
MSSPFLIRLTAHTSILALRCRTRLTSNQGRGTPLYSLEGSVNGLWLGAGAGSVYAPAALGWRYWAAPELHR